MAQGLRPTKAHLRSADRARTSQISYFQKRDGPLRFFLSWQRINITAVGAWYGNFTFAKRSDGPAASKVSKLNRVVVACCAEYQADLDIINDKAKVFWNPYGTRNGSTLSEL